MAKSSGGSNEAQIPIGVSDNTDSGLKAIGTKLKANLDSWKRMAGEESVFGNTFKALRGAGAVAGLTLAGNSLRDVTAKAVELRKEFQAGQKDAAELGKGLAESLPVVGQFVTAAYNIREAITGERAAIDEMVRAAAQTEKFVANRYKAESELRGILKQQVDQYDQIQRRIDLINKTGLERQRQAARDAADTDIKGFREAAAEKKKVREQELRDEERGVLDEIKRLQSQRRPEISAFDPDRTAAAQRAFDQKQAADLAEQNKRLDRIRRDKLTFKATIDQGARDAIALREREFSAQNYADSKAEAERLKEQQRQERRELDKREGELRRARMTSDAARRRDEAEEKRRFADEDLKYEKDLMPELRERKRNLIGQEYEQQRTQDVNESTREAQDVILRGANNLIATVMARAQGVVDNFTTPGGFAGISHGAANLAQGIFDAVTLRKFFKDQEDSKDYLKRMWELMRKQQQPQVFNGRL